MRDVGAALDGKPPRRAWGANHDSENNLIVDAHQQTPTDGLYAAGDVVLGLNQIAIATAEAAIAATDIHNRLRP